MITPDNYFEITQDLDFSGSWEEFKADHDTIVKFTKNGADWSLYEADEEFREGWNLYFKDLALELEKAKGKAVKPTTPTPKKPTAPKSKKTIKAKPPAPRTKKKTPVKPAVRVRMVERISDTVALLKRVYLLHNKDKTGIQVRRIVNALQKAILEKRINKGIVDSAILMSVQYWLIDQYNSMQENKAKKLTLPEDLYNQLSIVIGKQKLRLAVVYLKRYLTLRGANPDLERVKRLHNQIAKAINEGKIPESDPSFKHIMAVVQSLKQYNQGSSLKIDPMALAGIQATASQPLVMDAETLAEIEELSGAELAGMEFESLGFQQPWLDFFGDPTPGFTMMVYAPPKLGKSHFMVGFANYLANYHGDVLYIAKEEGFNQTMKNKIEANAAYSQHLTIRRTLPDNLSSYAFVVLDSVSALGFSPADLKALKKAHPRTAFIYIFHSTKGGSYRGVTTFEHDVDMVVEFTGFAQMVQRGRFQAFGEMNLNPE